MTVWVVEEAKERLSSTTGEELLKQRKVRAEGVFALAKELHGLRMEGRGGDVPYPHQTQVLVESLRDVACTVIR